MSWIESIGYSQATGALLKLYDKIKGTNNHIDNVLLIHSLRPHTLKGHMMLYKSVLHHRGNQLEKWYLEALGVYVSKLNACTYCHTHHAAGLERLLSDKGKSDKMLDALLNDRPQDYFEGRELLGIAHAKQLTLSPQSIVESEITQLKNSGFTEGEILEINQVVSYFNYVNRTVVGLGVTLENENVGLSPNDSDNVDNWSHS